MIKLKLLNLIKYISLKIYLKLDKKYSKVYIEYIRDRIMAEFHY